MRNTHLYSKTQNKQTIYARRMDQKPDRKALWVGLGALVVILPLLFICGTLIFFQVRQLNLPNVFVYDRGVGMISQDETAALVDQLWNLDRTIQLMAAENPDIQYQLTPKDFGLWVDPLETAIAAYSVGRTSEPFPDLRAAINSQSRIIMPVLYYDQSQARQTLESIRDDLHIPPIDAAVAFQDGAWTALPGSDGRTVDIDRTLDNLSENAFSVLTDGSVQLYVQAVPPQVADLSPLLDEIESVIEQDLRLSAYDPITDQSFIWSVPDEHKGGWVFVDPKTHEVSLSIKDDDVQQLLSIWSRDLGDERSFEAELETNSIIEGWGAGKTPLVTVYHDPTIYTVSRGESLWSISLKLGMPMWYIMEANPGLTINTLSVGMNLAIPSKNILLPLPAIPNKRIVIDISEQRMTVYEDGQVRNTHIVSTGVEDSPTMAGVFQVQTHQLNAYASNWDLYMPHFLGIYEAWPGFMNGIHGLPLLSSGNRLWASNLGSPASYGCIILDLAAAEDLYHWADPGVVVEINK
jgi:lipoprotein-anchoring transpeptidase ErfK/SrfK